MLFGFFLRTGKTFGLLSKANMLSDLPELCSSGSSIIPHILRQVNQVIPCLITNDSTKSCFIPLFVPMWNGKILSLDDLKKPDAKCYLVFYPSPENIPVTISNISNKSLLIGEYWSNIQPMTICRDVGGYYLGCLNDPSVLTFEVCQSGQSMCHIIQGIRGFNEFTCYGKHVKFGNDPIYLRKSV